MPSARKVEIAFFFLAVAIAAALSFFILRPYLGAIFVAIVFSVAFGSLHDFFLRVCRGRNLAALATIVFLFLSVLIPATLFGFFVFDDAQKLYISAAQGESLLDQADRLAAPIERGLQAFIPDIKIALSDYLEEGLSFLVGNLGGAFAQMVGLVFKAVIMLLALFYLLRDGKELHSYVVKLSPLSNEYDERILKRLGDAINSVVKGRLLIVFIQGILSALGFFLFGIPHPLLMGALTVLAALVPAIGVAIVFVPAVLYLFFTGGVVVASGLLIFGVLIGMIDNLLGPILFERGMKIHPLLILLSILGGLAFFGPIGFLAGPVTLSLLFALLDIYPLLFQEQKR